MVHKVFIKSALAMMSRREKEVLKELTFDKFSELIKKNKNNWFFDEKDVKVMYDEIHKKEIKETRPEIKRD